MKAGRALGGFVILVILGAGAWAVFFHPEWIKPAPGEEEEETAEAGEIGVRVAKVVRTTLHRTVDAYGRVVPAPATASTAPASARLAAPVAGIVTEVPAVEGAKVAKGDLLVQLDERVARAEEDAAAAEVERSQSAEDFARRAFERQKKLREQDVTAERKLQEAEAALAAARGDVTKAEKALAAAKARRSLLRIVAPLDGTVVRVRVHPGEAVDALAVVVEIVDPDRLVVEAAVPSEAAARVKPGQHATFGPAEGTVVYVGPEIDVRNDTVPVRISVPEGSGLRPGATLPVRLVVEERADRLAVPWESVVRDDEGGSRIFVVDGGTASPHAVTVGVREGVLMEIGSKDVAEGATVVTSGSYMLPGEGARVRVIQP